MSNPYEPPQHEAGRKSSFGFGDLLYGNGGVWIRLPIVLGILAAYYVFVASNESTAYGFQGPVLVIRYGERPMVGVAIAAVCLAAVGAFGVWPRGFTGFLAAIAIVLWLGAAASMVVVFL